MMRPPIGKSYCAGPVSRREFLRVGVAGFAGLSLPGLLRLRAAASTGQNRERTALIVVWLHGGHSHLDTYDPKPLAPSDYRGPFQPIRTSVAGLQYSELLPRQAAIAHRCTLLRSLAHTGICHDSGPHQIFTGRSGPGLRIRPDYPDLFCITNSLRHDASRTVPNYIGLHPIPYLGPAYLGLAYQVFAVFGDPNAPNFEVPSVGVKDANQVRLMEERLDLRQRLDRVSRDVDEMTKKHALDTFQTQAWNLLTGSQARKAFDVNLEDPRVRDRYGRNTWGQRCLLARRLVEAGVDLVTVTLGGPMCGRTNSWDDHAVNHHVFDALKSRAPYFDQAVSALIEEVHERGLDKRVMVIVAGDFGRTPKISYAADSASGVTQPGRDHWPSAMSFLFSGGSIPEGQVIGATNRRGEEPVERRLGVGDFLATVYRHLGVDAERISFNDLSGRPIPILAEGSPIPELCG